MQKESSGEARDSNIDIAQPWLTESKFKTICGASLDAIACENRTIVERTAAAYAFGSKPCRRGLERLKRTYLHELRQFQSQHLEPYRFPAGPNRNFLCALLFAIARIDSPKSHEALKRFLMTVEHPDLRSDVLEAMAFEEDSFDLDLIVPFVQPEISEPMLLSALYALLLHGDRIPNNKFRDRHLVPLLKHESERVRLYTVQVLGQKQRYLPTIRTLQSDPCDLVREGVQESIGSLYS